MNNNISRYPVPPEHKIFTYTYNVLLLSPVRFDSVDPIMFVLLEIHPIYPDVVLAPGILINVEIHVEDVVTWKIKRIFSFLSSQLKPYIVISPERRLFYKIDLLISTMEIISSENRNMHFNIKLKMFLQNISVYFYCIWILPAGSFTIGGIFQIE